MTTDSTFRKHVLAGELLFGTWVGMGSPMVAEISGRAGFDWIVLDLEHGSVGEAGLLPMLLAVEGTPAVPLVRVEQASRLRIGRALDLGARGLVVPQVSNAEEAREIVSWMRFPPGGRRGVALPTRGLDYGAGGHASVDAKNQAMVGIFQIETREAVAEVEEIAAVDGADVLFVGPADLSHALGVRGLIDHEDYVAAIRRIGAAARAHGKAAGTLLWQPDHVRLYRDAGFSFFSVSSDGPIFDRALRQSLAATREAADRH